MSLSDLPTTEGIGAIALFFMFKIMKFLNDSHTNLAIMKDDTKRILNILDKRLPKK